MTNKKNLFIMIGLSSLLIITASLGYYIHYLGMFENRTDPIDTNLIYDIEKGDYFIFNSSQSQNMMGNISFGGDYYVMYQNGSWDFLRLREIVNNTNFQNDSIEYCNVTFDESVGLLKYNFLNNEIIDLPDDETFKISMEIPIAMKIQNYMPMMYINITSGNATDVQISMDNIEWGSIFESEIGMGNTTITLDLSYEGNAFYGIQVGDTFDILPYDNSSFPEAPYYPEVDTNFIYIANHEMITNATLGGIFQQPIAFPKDISMESIIQNGSGLLKTFIFMIAGTEDTTFDNFFTDNEWVIEQSYNTTFAEIFSDKSGGYRYTYIESGYNDTEDVQYNMTINIAFNITLTERNILDNFKALISIEDILSNRTTSESLYAMSVEMGIEEDLIYSHAHYNDIELDYDESALINENAEINVTIDDSRITGLLYLDDDLLKTFDIDNKTFNVSYSEAGNYTFTLEIYHEEELNDSIEFTIEFYENIIPEEDEEEIQWYWLATIIGTIILAIAVVYMFNRD